MRALHLQMVRKLYGIEYWGGGYFDINEQGNLSVSPGKQSYAAIDVKSVIDDLVAKNVSLPIILRFPQILSNQIKELHESFQKAILEYQYQGLYLPVYPIKVNQHADVVGELLRSGNKYNLGIEIGSKSELLVALALEQKEDSLLICNGFKDSEYVEQAALGVRLGKHVILVIEKLYEADLLIQQIQNLHIAPEFHPKIGIRMRLSAKGSGRWGRSSGSTSKFGLTTQDLLVCIDRLKRAGMHEHIEMLHCHVGSQITEIRRIKNAMKEAARIYAKVQKLGIAIRYLNVGGGLGVDYDGSKTSSDSSVNYSMQEFANDVVYTIKTICESEQVQDPSIVTETGRALTAYHEMLVANVITEINRNDQIIEQASNDPYVIQELLYLRDEISIKNFREYYHDALHQKEELTSLFNLGYLDLEHRAKGETIFWEICKKAVGFAQKQKFVPEEFEQLERQLAKKYVCNFSLFQSLPDNWAIEQLFPILPIHRLDELPEETATLVDLTCDSDGEIDNFVDLKDIKQTIAVHGLNGLPYYIGILLIGAYQDTMGSFHNLLGRVNEAHVILDENRSVHLQKIIKGNASGQVIEWFGYDSQTLAKKVEFFLEKRQISPEDKEEFLKLYRRQLGRSPYLR